MVRKLVLVAAITAVLLTAAFGTLAYFTAEGKASNVITAGNIKMTLHEESADGRPSPQSVSGLMPGQSVDRIVFVENTGDNAFYTRVKIKPAVQAASGSALGFDQITLDIDTASWKLGTDGWYYYQSAVGKGIATKPLFKELQFAPGMGNDYMNASVSIQVVAQAVQCANNGETVSQAAGWPAEPAKG